MDVKRTNRNALGAFVALLVLFMMLAGGLVTYAQRELLLQEARRDIDDQLQLLAELTADALLRSDYASVETMMVAWAKNHHDVVRMRVTAANGFVLAQYASGAGAAAVTRVRELVSKGNTPFTIEVARDNSDLHEQLLKLSIRFFAVAIVFITVMGWFLWRAIKRNALIPLYAEIARREFTEGELRHRGQALEAANKELDAFCYSVSHDLRAPLRGIDGFSQVLLEDYGGKLDSGGQEYLRRVRAATQRMGQLIDDLLRLSRLSTESLTITDINLSALVQDIIGELRQRDPARDTVVSIAPAISARGDARLLRSVLENLLGNAWKYTGKKQSAVIEFGAMQQDGEPVYFVRDNGAGFDMQYAGKLFGAFQRMHKPEDFPGAGIGLALSMRIVRRHGGRIWAEAQPDRGATFFFTLAV